MNIVKLNGEDTELYRRVAHLVMNREVPRIHPRGAQKQEGDDKQLLCRRRRRRGIVPDADTTDTRVQKRLRYHIRHPEQTHPGLQALRVFGNVRMGKIRENDIQRR